MKPINIHVLRKRFTGRPIEFIENDDVMRGICRSIHLTAGSSPSVEILWIDDEQEDRRDVATECTIEKGELSGTFVGTLRTFVMRVNPLVQAHHTLKLQHEAAAKKVWDDFALDLTARIPESCREFAENVGWIRSTDRQFHDAWQLPTRIERWIRYTQETGIGSVNEFCEGELEDTGFENCRDARKKLRELAVAWKDFFRIRLSTQWHQGEIEKITMTICVIGYRKKRRAKAKALEAKKK